jgi:hypothetical protein
VGLCPGQRAQCSDQGGNLAGAVEIMHEGVQALELGAVAAAVPHSALALCSVPLSLQEPPRLPAPIGLVVAGKEGGTVVQQLTLRLVQVVVGVEKGRVVVVQG